jgi:hypothetical protein
MKYLNGMAEEPPKNPPLTQASFVNELPEPVDTQLLAEISKRIELMNANYNLYIRRNRLLSVAAMIEVEIKNIEDEIKRL